MKNLILLLLCVACNFIASAQASTADYRAIQTGSQPDTFTNAQTNNYIIAVKGSKTAITVQDNITKVSGTLAGTIKVYGSADNGQTYGTAIINTYTITDASQVGQYSMTYNGYDHYKIVVATTGTNVSYHELWVLYRN